MKTSEHLIATLMLVLSTHGATVVLNTDFEADTIGSDPAMTGAGDIGGSYTPGTGDQSVQATPETNGNISSKVLFGGDQSANFNQGIIYFAGGNQPINGLSIAYDFYCANNGGDADEGVRVALPRLNIVPDPQGASGTLFLEMTARGILQVNNARYVVQYSDNLVDWYDLDEVRMLSAGVAQPGGANETDTLDYASDVALPSLEARGVYRVMLQAD